MAVFSPLLNFMKANIKRATTVFTIDKTARFWQTLPDELKQFALRAAQLNEEPKYWGGYTTEEKRRIRNTFLTFHELDTLRLAMEKEDKLLEERVNKPEKVVM